MAVTLQTLQDGERNLVVHVSATGGDSDSIVADVSALVPPCTQVAIKQIQWSVGGAVADGAVLLEWEATTDVVAWLMPCASSDCVDFREIGGLQNPMGTGATGDLSITTPADTPATLTIWMVKKYD